MISRETLVQTARRLQTTELNVAREYCQHLFLRAFYSERGSEHVMFKGGTALRILYGSPRFSEDLDFSGFRVQVKEIEDWVTSAAAEMEREALAVSIQESKVTSGGYLGIVACPVHDLPVQLQLQVSLRQRGEVAGRGVVVTPDLLPAYTLTQLLEELIVREKLGALASRGKPRDYYDLYFMLRKGMVSPEMLSSLSRVKGALAKCAIDFDQDLGPFLPRNQATLLKEFPRVLLEELARHGV